MPGLLKAAPERDLAVTFASGPRNKHSDRSAATGGASVDADQLHQQPTIDWPLDSTNPDALWTVACVDLDSVVAQSEVHQRTTRLANETPLRERLVWLVVNAPAPHLVNTGHVLCPWDAQPQQLQDRKELHRLVTLVFRQRAPVDPKSLKEFKSDEAHHDESQRVRSLGKLLHGHAEILSDHSWAGSFFTVDCQPAEASKGGATMLHGVEPPLAKVDAQLKHHQDAKERSQDRRAAANIKAARLHANEGYALGTEPEAPHWNKNEEQAQANERNADDASGTAKLH